MIKASELRIGNHLSLSLKSGQGRSRIMPITVHDIIKIEQNEGSFNYDPIPLSEGLLVAAGLDLIDENSAGKRFGFLKDMVFDSDMTFVLWKTTERAGKIFRNGKEVKFLHNLQNLFYDLTDGEELSFDLSIVGVGLGDSLGQPPAAEAIRDADSTATKDGKITPLPSSKRGEDGLKENWVYRDQEAMMPTKQICYKSNKPCKYNCEGLCKDSY
jgi:hypothetical protein